MMLGLPGFWFVLMLLPCIGVFLLYNRLIKLGNSVREAWSGIDVQLKRRHELIPRLAAVAKRYATHEAGLFEAVAHRRSQAAAPSNLAARETYEQNLSLSIRPLLALAEAYPDLKADQNYLHVQTELVAIEDVLQMARRYYNGAVRDYNNLVETFPGNLVARLFHFLPRDFFEIDAATERIAPRIDISGEQDDRH